ncbi:GNAT family N-acetyltransferase [Rhizobiaceae bacterium n13]|uniref:GNAT family N-acetyltransferase n=1 Tax=Ferirhizobium litorale TaxID=2927786 RepID=A0AAE3QC73_9HYPH|nr:GNAT family N-acetyltransferase [Fererhizobium litorale]MDI7864882.1 GNAT family N-acetyltransferase [Fererhizobium litorale]MDI7923107.1 GNAT family N-acetyltransferase [Fererhizobium litorale]
MGSLEIRPINAGDEAHWRRLWTAYLTFYETVLPDEIYASTFARILSGVPNEYRGLLAVLDGRPVGLAHYLFHRSCWHIEDVCYLQDLFADPEVRGKGIGRALIEAVYQQAQAAGSTEVYWMTQEFNATARKLYDRIAAKTPFLVYQQNF